MKSVKWLIISSLIILLIVPNIARAVETQTIYGVRIYLKNNNILNGYILTYQGYFGCTANTDNCDKWDSFFKRMRELQDSSSDNPTTITFISKLIEFNYDYGPKILAAKSSIKEVKIEDIKRIEDVHKKWSNIEVSAFYGIPEITDYMADYATKNKMIAAYTFNHEDVPSDNEDYAFGNCTTYISYNPEYTRKRLMKQRRSIDKMSEHKLDEYKLIRLRWAYD